MDTGSMMIDEVTGVSHGVCEDGQIKMGQR